MTKQKKGTEIKEFENVQNALSKSEAFIEKNQKILLYGLFAVLIVVFGTLTYKNQYLEPKENEAKELIYRAEQYFAQDSFRLALEGDGESLGFLTIIDEYSMTNTADLAKAYAGICYKSMGEYEKAISYLKDFNKKDQALTPSIKGAIGDCYLGMGNKEEALSFFKKAAATNNEIISPLYLERAGLIYIDLGDYKKAVSTFEEIKNKYPNSIQGLEADKFIQLSKVRQTN
jgi:tetratricopeptide (TPR) repeat protein